MSLDTTKQIKALLIAPLIGPILFYGAMLIESEPIPNLLEAIDFLSLLWVLPAR